MRTNFVRLCSDLCLCLYCNHGTNMQRSPVKTVYKVEKPVVTSSTLVQHCINVIQTFGVYREETEAAAGLNRLIWNRGKD